MMFLSPAAILALAAVVTATVPGPTQCDPTASAIPPCATDCIVSAGAQFGCSKLDYWCQCEPDTYANINGAALNCVLGACGFDKALPVLDAANAVCSCASQYPSPTSTDAPTATDPPVITSDPPVTTTDPPVVTTDPPTPTTDSPSCEVTPGPTQCIPSALAIPPCATDCIISAGANYGCSLLDFYCQCEPETNAAIQFDALYCVLDSCGADNALPVIDAANAVCACASSYPPPPCTGGPTATTGPPTETTPGPGTTDATSTAEPTTEPTPTTTPGTPCSVTPGPTQCDASASAIPPCATDL
ncbi:hypothetical protein V494_07592 [Pseudogymnoascus sp. VKM F-4513 (FW-928)]|nr:hypothetical protein V494_07592 [Pseudogymnoascus sp. VKM F-4513 (FW-928)]